MKISTILDHIDSGHMALPEFQRGYVWNRDQVRGLFDSLYRRHPVGGLLVWATESKTATHRGDGPLAAGVVKLLLDGQQRMTSLYGVVRGKPPKFFDGNAQAFTGLRFHLDTETFEFYQPVKMKDDPLWIDVTELMKKGTAGLGEFVDAAEPRSPRLAREGRRLRRAPEPPARHHGRGPARRGSHRRGQDARRGGGHLQPVNSGGTKLSKGDLALAKICADWPEARDTMKAKLKEWAQGRLPLQPRLAAALGEHGADRRGEVPVPAREERGGDSGRPQAGDEAHRHQPQPDRRPAGPGPRPGVLRPVRRAGDGALPRPAQRADGREGARQAAVLVRAGGHVGALLRFHGVVHRPGPGGARRRRTAGWTSCSSNCASGTAALRVEPGHFTGWSLGARFYPVLYLLTRMGEARDWGTGLPLKASLLGKMSRLEVHHIFPKAQLYKRKYKRPEVNALANFCFLTKDTNLDISDRLPEEYFPEVEEAHPGALASQWIPDGPSAVEDRELPRLPRSAQGAAGCGAQPAHGGTAARRHPLAGRSGGGGPAGDCGRWRHHQRGGRGASSRR